MDEPIQCTKEQRKAIESLRRDAERWRKHGKPALEAIVGRYNTAMGGTPTGQQLVTMSTLAAIAQQAINAAEQEL